MSCKCAKFHSFITKGTIFTPNCWTIKTRRQKAGFLSQRSFKIIVTMKRKGEKKSMLALLVLAEKKTVESKRSICR